MFKVRLLSDNDECLDVDGGRCEHSYPFGLEAGPQSADRGMVDDVRVLLNLQVAFTGSDRKGVSGGI